MPGRFYFAPIDPGYDAIGRALGQGIASAGASIASGIEGRRQRRQQDAELAYRGITRGPVTRLQPRPRTAVGADPIDHAVGAPALSPALPRNVAGAMQEGIRVGHEQAVPDYIGEALRSRAPAVQPPHPRALPSTLQAPPPHNQLQGAVAAGLAPAVEVVQLPGRELAGGYYYTPSLDQPAVERENEYARARADRVADLERARDTALDRILTSALVRPEPASVTRLNRGVAAAGIASRVGERIGELGPHATLEKAMPELSRMVQEEIDNAQMGDQVTAAEVLPLVGRYLPRRLTPAPRAPRTGPSAADRAKKEAAQAGKEAQRAKEKAEKEAQRLDQAKTRAALELRAAFQKSSWGSAALLSQDLGKLAQRDERYAKWRKTPAAAENIRALARKYGVSEADVFQRFEAIVWGSPGGGQ